MSTQVAQAQTEAMGTKKIKTLLWMLCVIFVLGTLCMQAFNLVFQNIGDSLGAPQYASLITSIPGIVLGIVCFIYGSLGDFVSLRKMMTVGLALLIIGSVAGFVCSFNIWAVIICRCIQTAGAQVSGSVYLVMVARYLEDKEKVTYFGIFNAAYQSSVLIGILAGGILTTINWTFLFLIPVISIVFIPYILKNVPNNVPEGNVHIDIPGFIIIGVAVMFLSLFFSNHSLIMLGISIASFVVFAIYISKAKHPFITPEFFKNRRWILATLLVFIFYFVNYSITPAFNAAGNALYGFTPAQVSFMLVPGFVVSLIVAVTSGNIDAKLGRVTSMILAAALIACGYFLVAFFITSGPVAIAICTCIIYAGLGLIYSPIYDTVTGTVPPNEAGRVLGLNDLALNVTASIGVSVFAPMMIANPNAPTNFIGKAGDAATYSNLFMIYGAIALAGLIVYVLIHKYLTSKA